MSLRVQVDAPRSDRPRNRALQRSILSTFGMVDFDCPSQGRACSRLSRACRLRSPSAPIRPFRQISGLGSQPGLDRGLDRPQFLEGDGRPLVEWPYRARDAGGTGTIARSDVAAFVDAVRTRISTPLPEGA